MKLLHLLYAPTLLMMALSDSAIAADAFPQRPRQTTSRYKLGLRVIKPYVTKQSVTLADATDAVKNIPTSLAGFRNTDQSGRSAAKDLLTLWNSLIPEHDGIDQVRYVMGMKPGFLLKSYYRFVYKRQHVLLRNQLQTELDQAAEGSINHMNALFTEYQQLVKGDRRRAKEILGDNQFDPEEVMWKLGFAIKEAYKRSNLDMPQRYRSIMDEAEMALKTQHAVGKGMDPGYATFVTPPKFWQWETELANPRQILTPPRKHLAD